MPLRLKTLLPPPGAVQLRLAPLKPSTCPAPGATGTMRWLKSNVAGASRSPVIEPGAIFAEVIAPSATSAATIA